MIQELPRTYVSISSVNAVWNHRTPEIKISLYKELQALIHSQIFFFALVEILLVLIFI